MEPDNSWNAGERKFTKNMMWSHTSWTEGDGTNTYLRQQEAASRAVCTTSRRTCGGGGVSIKGSATLGLFVGGEISARVSVGGPSGPSGFGLAAGIGGGTVGQSLGGGATKQITFGASTTYQLGYAF
jgi:hypothetical protein